MGDREVFKYKDIVVHKSDLDTLKGPYYLTDEIIAFYFRYLSSFCKTDDILLFQPSQTVWLANGAGDEDVSMFAESEKLSTKRLVVFPVNDCCASNEGSHWSVLVYSRSMNAFLHFDSMGEANSDPAEKLYEAVKKYMGVGGQVPSAPEKKQKNKNKKARPVSLVSKPSQVVASAAAAPDGLPVFKEAKTPQQTNGNGYDCGLYVLAIAEVIIDCFKDGSDSNSSDLPSIVARGVDQSIESSMRPEILELVNNLRKNVSE